MSDNEGSDSDITRVGLASENETLKQQVGASSSNFVRVTSEDAWAVLPAPNAVSIKFVSGRISSR